MKINYNVTGAERKTLVGAISQKLNSPIKYLGAPSFAYEVGGYIIEKNGMVVGADNTELMAELQELHSLIPITEEYDEPVSKAPEVPDNTDISEMSEDESTSLVIEMPMDDFTQTNIANLEKLVESKASLIKKAIGADNLTIEQTEDMLRFPWFNPQGDVAAVRAYTKFIAALCTMAKEQKRITSTVKEVENEKYAFRCFLLRLGFIGDDFKAERKILLSKLSGNSSFKSGERQPTENETVSAE